MKSMIFCVAVFGFIGFLPSNANAQQGTTSITIGSPTYDGPPITKATVPFNMSLAAAEKGFDSIQVTVTYQGLLGPITVPVALGLVAPPVPNGPVVTVKGTFSVTKGTKYTIVAQMNYYNSNNILSNVKNNTTITP